MKTRRKFKILMIGAVLAASLCACGSVSSGQSREASGQTETSMESAGTEAFGEPDGAEGEDTGFTSADRNTKVQDVIQSPVFGEYGRLIFLVDQTIPDDLTLEHVESILPWYSDVIRMRPWRL